MKICIYLCWIAILLGCAVSLYYGEILMIEPCRLCWYQRIALFPLAWILGAGLYRNDRSMVVYALPLALFGTIIALFQAIGMHFPFLQICGQECAKPIFFIFGVVTFPDLSALGFALISAILIRELIER